MISNKSISDQTIGDVRLADDVSFCRGFSRIGAIRPSTLPMLFVGGVTRGEPRVSHVSRKRWRLVSRLTNVSDRLEAY